MSVSATAALPLLDARTDAERRQRRIAIAMMCGTMVFYTLTDTSAKWLGLQHLPLLQIIWARYTGATLVALLVANPIAAPHRLRSARPGLQMLRALFLLGSTATSFGALRSLQLAESYAINFALPLVVALAAGPVLGEWVGPRRFLAIGVGFLGVLVVVQPWTGSIHPAMLLSLASVLFGAGYNMMTRMVAQRDPARTTLIYSTLVGSLLLTPFVAPFWVSPPGAAAWVVLVGIGLFGAAAHLLMILAHARAPAAILAPFTYTQILWAMTVGLVIFGDVPHPITLLGAGIVVLSGLYLWHRERGEKAKAQP